MVYVDPALESRRKSILGGTTVTPQGSVVTGSQYPDPSFQSRRTQILSQPQPVQPQPVTVEPVQQVSQQQNVFDKIGQFISQKLNKYVAGGIQAGIERVKKPPVTEYIMPLAKRVEPARKYVKDTLLTGINAIKGAGKLTPAYMTFRAAQDNPVSPKEYAQNLIDAGLQAIGFTWRMQPAAPLVGAGLNSWVGVRRYFEGKIEAGDLMSYPLAGINEQPGLGAVFTDNLKIAQAIDIAFLATMFVKPVLSKKVSQLNLRAEEISSLRKTLGVKPDATMKEIQQAFKEKMKKYPDTFTATPNPENMEIRKQLTNAYNILKNANVIEMKYAQAYEFLQSKIGNPIRVEPIKPKPKQLPQKIEQPEVKAETKIVPEKVIQPTQPKGVGGVDDILSGKKPIFHGTDKKFTKFDSNASREGGAWFTDRKQSLTEGSITASGKGVIMERYIKPNTKLLDYTNPEHRKLIDNLMPEQLQREGWEGIISEGDNAGERFIHLFNPNKSTTITSASGVGGVDQKYNFLPKDSSKVTGDISKLPDFNNMDRTPTGWKYKVLGEEQGQSNGVALINKFTGETKIFDYTNPSSGLQSTREFALAHAWAIDNPVTMRNVGDSTAEIITKPLVKETPLSPTQPKGVGGEQPLFRGTSLDEWKAVLNGDKFGNLRTAEGLRGETYLSNSDRFSGKYKDFATNNNSGVLIEFKPQTTSKIIGKDPHAIGLTGTMKGGEKSFVAKDVRLEDVSRVTDMNGKVIYEAPTQPKGVGGEGGVPKIISQTNKYKSAIEKIKQFIPDAKFELDYTFGKPALYVEIPNVGNVIFDIPDKKNIVIYSAGNIKDTERLPFKGTGKVTKVIRSLMALAKDEGKNIEVVGATGSGYWDHLGFNAKEYITPGLTPKDLAKIPKLKEFSPTQPKGVGGDGGVTVKPTRVTTPKVKVTRLGKAKPVKKVISTKETRSLQTVISDRLGKIRNVSKTPQEMNKGIDELYEYVLNKAKNDKVVLSSFRTALNKEMFGLVGTTDNYKADYATLFTVMDQDPETGVVIKRLMERIDQLDEKLLEGKRASDLGFNPKNIADPESPQAAYEAQKLVRKSEIAKQLSEKLSVPIRRGKFNRSALGIFKPLQKVVRIKGGGLQTVFHEVGHFLDSNFNFSEKISVAERIRLMEEYAYTYAGQPKKQKKEAFAEFLRFMMTGQEARARKLAPEYSKQWDTYMKNLPEIKEVIDTATNDYKRWLAQPASAKILSHISVGSKREGSLLDKANSTFHDVYTAAVDDLHPLSEYVKIGKKYVGVPAVQDPYILARNLRGWTGKADLFLTRGTFNRRFWSYDKKGRAMMEYTGKSYAEIIRPVEKMGAMDDFRVYLASKRALELSDRNIVTGINRTDAEEALKEQLEKHPEFEKIGEERLKYKDALLNYAADPSVGLIGKEGLAKIKKLNKFHVPFYRVMEESQGAAFMGRRKVAGNLSSPIKKIKGSEREILDPIESDIKDTYAIINASERNAIGVAMANLSSANYELGRLFEKVDRPMQATKVEVKEVLDKALKNTDLTLDDLPEELGDAVVTLFRPTYAQGQNMLNVNMGDKKKVFQVDPELFKSIQGLEAEDAGVLMRILSMPARLLRAGATLTPDFSMRNPLRDQFSAFIYSRNGYIPGIDLIRGMFETFGNKNVYELWKAGGGEHAMLVSMDRQYMQKKLTEVLHEKRAKAIKYVKNPVELLRVLSEFGEQGTRLGEMKRAIMRGKDPIQAAYESREVTLDFARIGTKTKGANQTIAFFNSNVQGNDKLIRSFKNRPYATLLKTLMGITLPSILLYLANRKDSRWKEIPAWQKNLFWIILTDKHIYRIPKPFEVGILFGSVPERVLEYIDTKNPKLFDQLYADVANGASPGFIPTGLIPIIENISNYSFFLNRPIVSRTKENLPPEAQHGQYTFEISKIIGRALNYSPAKVENLVTGYTGGLGRYALQAIDKVLTGTGTVKIPPKPALSLSDLPVIKAFMVRDPAGSSSESVNQLYNLYGDISGKVTYIRNLAKDGREEEAVKYVKAHPEVIDYGILSGAVQTFSDISRARDMVLDSEYLTPEEKRQKIRKLDEVQTTVAQQVLQNLKSK